MTPNRLEAGGHQGRLAHVTSESIKRRWNVVAFLEAHGVFLSDDDETELIQRAATTEDVGELALRTCLCGERIDGFDAYIEHLREAFTSPG